jgi:hypothetical protein
VRVWIASTREKGGMMKGMVKLFLRREERDRRWGKKNNREREMRGWLFFGELDRGRSMCVTRRCRLCIIIEECCS